MTVLIQSFLTSFNSKCKPLITQIDELYQTENSTTATQWHCEVCEKKKREGAILQATTLDDVMSCTSAVRYQFVL
jgi:ubiquitin C-terminal hydrolase